MWRLRARASAALVLLAVLFLAVGDAAAATQMPAELGILVNYVLIMGLAIGVFVGVVMVYTILKFRMRKGHTEPAPNISTSNHSLEAAWTIIPAVILLVVGVLAFQALAVTDTLPAHPDVVVTVIGHQWYWEFYTNYTANGTSVHSLGTFTVKANQTVQLIVEAADVMHSFLVPQIFGLHIDAVPGHVNQFWFEATVPGSYEIVCTQFCGTGHYTMTGTLNVLPS